MFLKYTATLVGMMACLGIGRAQQFKKDSVAIVRLLEKEAATWRSGDVKSHAECWQLRPYSRILISKTDGGILDIPPTVMVNPPANSTGQGGYAELSDFRMHIGAQQAWVSHHEVSVSKEGQKNYSYEIRLLEKVKGQWKLVGQSIHAYLPQ